MSLRVAFTAVSSLALLGCAHRPPAWQPVTPSVTPTAGLPSAAPAPSVSPPPAAAEALEPRPALPAPAHPAPSPRVKPTPPAAPATTAPRATPPAPAPALDLTALEERLKNTPAIGVFTKLSLKNQVDELLGEFRQFHHGTPGLTLAQLRQRYDLLLMKVLSLLQDGDPTLAAAIASSREAIWAMLIDPKSFAKLSA